MNKIEFENQIREKESQIQALRDDIKNIKNEYIESNREFKDGDIVRVYKGSGSNNYALAFVVGYEISWNSDLRPILKKMKKDGTQSQHGIFVWISDRIELHEGAK